MNELMKIFAEEDKIVDDDEVFAEGYDAATRDIRYQGWSSCPYVFDDEKFEIWQAGYDAGLTDMEVELELEPNDHPFDSVIEIDVEKQN